MLFKRARGVGVWGEDLTALVWRSGPDSASEIARRCQVARSKAGTPRGLCIPRSLPRWHDPDPLGVLSPAYITENRKGRRGGARAMHRHRVLSDEAEEFRGYHCLGRSLQDSAHQLVQLLCHHCIVILQLRCTKRAGHGQPRARTGHKTILKHV